MPCLNRRKGLSLVEVMVSMALLGATLSGFIGVFMMNQRTVTVANNQQREMHQARAVMEDLFALSYYDSRLSVGNHTVGGGCAYIISETNKLKTITVTRTWTNALEKTASVLVLKSALSQAIHK
ncbi:MAG: type II secretion system protein [bacterium]|jgi:prepilin-type N-terminal cleavage/methylation domain-containing protein